MRERGGSGSGGVENPKIPQDAREICNEKGTGFLNVNTTKQKAYKKRLKNQHPVKLFKFNDGSFSHMRKVSK